MIPFSQQLQMQIKDRATQLFYSFMNFIKLNQLNYPCSVGPNLVKINANWIGQQLKYIN